MQDYRWKDISSAPQNQTKMFVVRAFNVNHGNIRNYTSDPVATWSVNGSFPRWKHEFAPTHWIELPELD
jgi:hypothetical protein